VLKIDDKTMRLREGKFVSTETKKDLIVLHFTAGGSAKSAFTSWSVTSSRIATAYILDTDGTVYEVFDPKFYAFHLGTKGTQAIDKRSIGIEIANFGPLKKKNGQLYSWPRDFNNPYNLKAIEANYRGFDYWAAYTDEQAAAIGPLVDMLCDRFGIPNVKPNKNYRLQYDIRYMGWKGVASHQNYRKDKTDVGPAFDWDLWLPNTENKSF
jgi:N-acetyl-anhydromuramyl-L-alanine amidase AmpD